MNKILHKTGLYALTVMCIIFCDAFTKRWALYACAQELLFNKFVSCHVVINRGISWSLLSFDSFLGFAFVNLVIICVIGVLCRHMYGEYRNGKHLWGESLVFAGAISNFIDRFIFGGVIDFIKISYQAYVWPIFNVADIAIVCGVTIMVSKFLKNQRREQ